MYNVDITNNGGTSFKVASGDYEFTVDSHGKGMTPPDTLLAGLGTCVGVYLRKYAEGVKLPLKEFSINVHAEFSKDRPIGFRDISVTIDLKGAQIDDMKKNALLAFIKNCPVHNTLKINPNVEISIK